MQVSTVRCAPRYGTFRLPNQREGEDREESGGGERPLRIEVGRPSGGALRGDVE